MIKVMFLDDMEERYLEFIMTLTGYGIRDRVEVDWAKDVKTAKEFLDSGKEYKLVMLDHDLERHHYEDLNGRHDGTGKEVVAHMTATVKPREDLLAVVHSWNPQGAKEMEQTLRLDGFKVHRQMFNKALCRQLAEGMSRILANGPS